MNLRSVSIKSGNNLYKLLCPDLTTGAPNHIIEKNQLLLTITITAHELIYTTGRIHQFLFTGEERV